MGQTKEPGRADRLKAALKENLKPRKAQARERRADEARPPEGTATDQRDSSAE